MAELSPGPYCLSTCMGDSWAWPTLSLLRKALDPYPRTLIAPDFRSGHGLDLSLSSLATESRPAPLPLPSLSQDRSHRSFTRLRNQGAWHV